MIKHPHNEMFEQLEVGSHVILDTALDIVLGDVTVYLRKGNQGKIVKAHAENDLHEDAQYRLWLVEFDSMARVWLRSYRISSEA